MNQLCHRRQISDELAALPQLLSRLQALIPSLQRSIVYRENRDPYAFGGDQFLFEKKGNENWVISGTPLVLVINMELK